MTWVLARTAIDDRKVMHEAGIKAARQSVYATYRERGHRIPFESVSIKKDALGKPYGHIHGESFSIPVSISHSFPFVLAAAAASDSQVGVDVERIRDFAPETRTAFLTSAEKDYIAAAPENRRPYLDTLAWSLKESVLKALGVGIRMHPKRVEVVQALAGGGQREAVLKIQGIPYTAAIEEWQVDPAFVATATIVSPLSVYTYNDRH